MNQCEKIRKMIAQDPAFLCIHPVFPIDSYPATQTVSAVAKHSKGTASEACPLVPAFLGVGIVTGGCASKKRGPVRHSLSLTVQRDALQGATSTPYQLI